MWIVKDLFLFRRALQKLTEICLCEWWSDWISQSYQDLSCVLISFLTCGQCASKKSESEFYHFSLSLQQHDRKKKKITCQKKRPCMSLYSKNCFSVVFFRWCLHQTCLSWWKLNIHILVRAQSARHYVLTLKKAISTGHRAKSIHFKVIIKNEWKCHQVWGFN